MPDDRFTVFQSGKLPMLFCSDLCRMTFGTSLGQPYTAEDMAEKHFTFKVHVRRLGWVQVNTTTQFFCNGLMGQVNSRIAAGEYTKCAPPKRGERIVLVNKTNPLLHP